MRKRSDILHVHLYSTRMRSEECRADCRVCRVKSANSARVCAGLQEIDYSRATRTRTRGCRRRAARRGAGRADAAMAQDARSSSMSTVHWTAALEAEARARDDAAPRPPVRLSLKRCLAVAQSTARAHSTLAGARNRTTTAHEYTRERHSSLASKGNAAAVSCRVSSLCSAQTALCANTPSQSARALRRGLAIGRRRLFVVYRVRADERQCERQRQRRGGAVRRPVASVAYFRAQLPARATHERDETRRGECDECDSRGGARSVRPSRYRDSESARAGNCPQ